MKFPTTIANDSPILERMYPVGLIVEFFVPGNPGDPDKFGFGTWALLGPGRTAVCVDAADPDFDAAGKMLGSKTHALTVAEMPSHGHAQDPHSHGVTDPGHAHVENSNNTSTGALRGWAAPDTSTNQSTATGYSTATATTGLTVNPATATNQSTGGGQPHDNVQPSIAVYRWRRTA